MYLLSAVIVSWINTVDIMLSTNDMYVCFVVDFGKCPFLDAPDNGFVVIRGFLVGDNATYFCNADYILMSGDHVRHCMTDGQ